MHTVGGTFSPPVLKKILLLTSATEGEEDVATATLGRVLKQLAPRGTTVEAVDLLELCQGRFEVFFGKAFASRGTRTAGDTARLGNLLREREPDVLLFSSPRYGDGLSEIFRDGRRRDFVAIALVLEPLFTPADWAASPADFFVTAGTIQAETLRKAGIPEKKIRIFGYPVSPPVLAKSEAAEDVPSQDESRQILYLVNHGRRKALRMLDRLLDRSGWKITVKIEDDADLEEKVKEKAASSNGRLTVAKEGADLLQLLRSHEMVISRGETALVQAAIIARCPPIISKVGTRREEANAALLQQANAGARAAKPREVVDWLKRAFRDKGRLLKLWRKNLEPLGAADDGRQLARFILQEAERWADTPSELPRIHALPPPVIQEEAFLEKTARVQQSARPNQGRATRSLLLCDFHTHTTWSDGKLTVRELVDFYGQRGFDCLCVTDHLCDPKRLLGKLVNLTGMVIPPGEVDEYFAAIEREKKRAWAKYDLLLMAGLEFNKDGYTAKTSAHLLGVDLRQPINPSLEIEGLIREIQAQGGLAIASHPHEVKSHWGKDTLYLWEHVDEFAPLLDAWEVANRDDIFNPVGLKKLPFVANSDFHKPKHIHSWKTLLHCEKEAEAIKECIRINRDVSITLYREEHRQSEEKSAKDQPERTAPETKLSQIKAG